MCEAPLLIIMQTATNSEKIGLALMVGIPLMILVSYSALIAIIKLLNFQECMCLIDFPVFSHSCTAIKPKKFATVENRTIASAKV